MSIRHNGKVCFLVVLVIIIVAAIHNNKRRASATTVTNITGLQIVGHMNEEILSALYIRSRKDQRHAKMKSSERRYTRDFEARCESIGARKRMNN